MAFKYTEQNDTNRKGIARQSPNKTHPSGWDLFLAFPTKLHPWHQDQRPFAYRLASETTMRLPCRPRVVRTGLAVWNSRRRCEFDKMIYLWYNESKKGGAIRWAMPAITLWYISLYLLWQKREKTSLSLELLLGYIFSYFYWILHIFILHRIWRFVYISNGTNLWKLSIGLPLYGSECL